jgi:DNA-binding response OmpR family regulator
MAWKRIVALTALTSLLVDSFTLFPSRSHRRRVRPVLQESNTNTPLDRSWKERNKQWIVIVDDEESIRSAVGDFLYDSGFQVTSCSDADSMLEVVNTPMNNGNLRIPAAIVSDIRMPGKDGIELLGLIRADERLARVPVILLTAKAMTQDRVAGYKAGADVYLPKPFNPDELLSIIDNAILRRRQMTSDLVGIKKETADIKLLMKQNSANLVKQTDVYLTPAEREVLDLLSKGYTNTEIAQERGVTLTGTNRAVQKLFTATQTRTRTELLRWAIETGYVAKR